MTVDVVTAVLLIVVPIAFNARVLRAGAAFDYPDILRREPDEILRRFHAGGAGLILRWEGFLAITCCSCPSPCCSASCSPRRRS